MSEAFAPRDGVGSTPLGAVVATALMAVLAGACEQQWDDPAKKPGAAPVAMGCPTNPVGTGGMGGTGPADTGGGEASGPSAAGGAGGLGGDGAPGNRCDGVPRKCGPDGTRDCCASSVIPGGWFYRNNDLRHLTSISTFRLDVYEVTVGRFRQFLANYSANRPTGGSGKNPHDEFDTGWDAVWDMSLESDVQNVRKGLRRLLPGCTFTETAGSNETLPIACETWFEAQAFCIWDGGRLPTDAELNYAATGGCEQRRVPWSTNPLDPATKWNDYAVLLGGKPLVVGSRSPQGDGKWGQADLMGNVWEWTADYAGPYPIPCVDCAVHVPYPPPAPLQRFLRGGSVYGSMGPLLFLNEHSGTVAPEYRGTNYGIRCARAP